MMHKHKMILLKYAENSASQWCLEWMSHHLYEIKRPTKKVNEDNRDTQKKDDQSKYGNNHSNDCNLSVFISEHYRSRFGQLQLCIYLSIMTLIFTPTIVWLKIHGFFIRAAGKLSGIHNMQHKIWCTRDDFSSTIYYIHLPLSGGKNWEVSA